MRKFSIISKNLAQTIPSLIEYLSSEGFYASSESIEYAGYFAWIEAQSNKPNLPVTEASLYAPISHENFKSRLDIRNRRGNLSVFLKPAKEEITAKIFYNGKDKNLASELEEHIKAFYKTHKNKGNSRTFFSQLARMFHQLKIYF